MIRVVCTCGRAFKAEDRHAGKHTKCPECGADLTIGPAPISSSSGGDVDEVPAWWYPSDPTAQAARATAPTRSGSDPGPDAVNTMVLPAGYDPQPKPHASSQSPPAAAPTSGSSVPPEGSGRGSCAGAGASVLSGQENLGDLRRDHRSFWFSPLGRFSGSVQRLLASTSCRPHRGELSWTSRMTWAKVSSRRHRCRVAIRNPRRTRIASTSTGDAAADTSPSGPQVDAAGQPKTAAASASRRLRLLVPAYIYPGGDGRKEWQRLIDAASKVEIVAIANPNSGPGDERNLDYAAIFTEASNQGITLVGYVSTDYRQTPPGGDQEGHRYLDPVLSSNSWVFLRPAASRKSCTRCSFAELRDYVKRKLRDPLVITNPGVPCDEAYLAQAVSNVTCVFVNYQGFEQFELPATLKAYDPSRFAAMPYNIPDVETMRTVVKDAIIKRIGYVYISDAKPPNQWGKLPAYWEAEVDAVSRVR